jgi:hypothetical protein
VRQRLIWYEVHFPREVDESHLLQVFRLLATSGGTPLVLEVVGSTDGVTHRLGVMESRAGGLATQLRQAVPGLDLVSIERSAPTITRAVALKLSTKRRQLRVDNLSQSAVALLAALSHVGSNEELVLQWILTRPLVPTTVPTHFKQISYESFAAQVITAPLFGPSEVDPDLRKALRIKQSEAGWHGIGRLGVRAASRTRERQLIRQVLGALRTLEAPGVGFRVHSTSPKTITSAAIPWWAPLRLNALELAALSAWPSGPTVDLPVTRMPSTLLPPSRGTAQRGRIIGDATAPGIEQPVALSLHDSLRHLHVIGPTGSGKSTLLCNLIVQDMEQGRGVVVIEPKGDLIEDVLRRVPVSRLGDVVILDPTDTEMPIGLNPLAREGRSAELVADQLLGVFHSLYASSWGPRTSDILGSALLTLARTPAASLVSLPILLTDARYRKRITGAIDDPIALGPFWAQFEDWSQAERTSAIAPSMNKLRPFIMRPELRGVLSQTHPQFEIRDVFRNRKILLVNLAKGQLGPESSALLGALVVAQLWQSVLGRSKIAPEKRHPVFIYVDEFQDYLKLPMDFADALAQSRGLGVGLVLAHQYLNQLDKDVRSAVLHNAQSRIAFRLAHEDAVALAHQTVPSIEDFESLPVFEAYAQLLVGGSVGRWVSLRTRPMGPATSDPEVIRSRSREAYGQERGSIDAAIRDLVEGPRSDNEGRDIGRRRRSGETP